MRATTIKILLLILALFIILYGCNSSKPSLELIECDITWKKTENGMTIEKYDVVLIDEEGRNARGRFVFDDLVFEATYSKRKKQDIEAIFIIEIIELSSNQAIAHSLYDVPTGSRLENRYKDYGFTGNQYTLSTTTNRSIEYFCKSLR